MPGHKRSKRDEQQNAKYTNFNCRLGVAEIGVHDIGMESAQVAHNAAHGPCVAQDIGQRASVEEVEHGHEPKVVGAHDETKEIEREEERGGVHGHGCERMYYQKSESDRAVVDEHEAEEDNDAESKKVLQVAIIQSHEPHKRLVCVRREQQTRWSTGQIDHWRGFGRSQLIEPRTKRIACCSDVLFTGGDWEASHDNHLVSEWIESTIQYPGYFETSRGRKSPQSPPIALDTRCGPYTGADRPIEAQDKRSTHLSPSLTGCSHLVYHVTDTVP